MSYPTTTDSNMRRLQAMAGVEVNVSGATTPE
ncbi:Uncharacterised protein [Mycobacteroides abscessus subsp. abscessus]|nr:Uncharacterised protein [Mycobacteroides abscessus subsp. abscessus]SKT67210.1 Uncharacterised protein [Mycobacteroides abscessus subsp. abscessus]